jgi:hypothetical protein
MPQGPIGQLALLLVAQQPFSSATSSFCKLLPIRYMNGGLPHSSEFKNDGEVWWMLNNRTRLFAQPGRLLVGRLEHANAFDEWDQTKSSIQVEIDSIREPERDELSQVLSLKPTDIDSEQDLVESFRIGKSKVFVPQVLVQWRGKYIGPFRTAEASAEVLRLVPGSTSKQTVYVFSEEAVHRVCKPATVADYVSKSQSPRRTTRDVQDVSFQYVLMEQLAPVWKQAAPAVVELESISSKVRRVASECLSRKAAQALKQMLEDLERKAIDSGVAKDLILAVQTRRSAVEADLQALDDLATKLLESGVLGEDRLEKAKQSIAQDFLQKNGEALRAKLDAELDSLNKDLEQLNRQRAALGNEIQSTRNARIAAIDAEVDQRRKALQKELVDHRAAVQRDRADIDRLQDVLKNNLSEVTRQFREAGDGVLNQYLTLEPLLGRQALREGSPREAESSAASPMASAAPHFKPRILRREAEQLVTEPMSERLFVDRVCKMAAARELRFRRADVERFHLSVKTGTITLLAGPSGTGKSSLATVYGEALRGTDTSQRASHHIVSVNPTWMDGRDLLGHLAAGDRRFVPAESGLFEFLVAAHLETDELGDSAGVCLALLDEINLAQVEHYFGEIMLALERHGFDRAIQLFSSDAVSQECAFRRHGRLRLSPNLRFVGTMNEDETTRQISDRFLDRVNLIRLEARTVIAEPVPPNLDGGDVGQPITLADFERWAVAVPLQSDVAEFIDRVRPLLERLDAPLSMRARNGIDRYIRSSTNLAPQHQALDYQIAQRMLPRVRLIGSRMQESALLELRSLLESADFSASESLAMIDAMQLRLRDTIVDDD